MGLQVGDTIIGRSRNCNLVLKDPSVSRNHALLIVGSDQVTIKDLNSTNGTYVNDQRLTSEVILQPGDRISIGQAELLLGRTEQPMPEGSPQSLMDTEAGMRPGGDLEPTSTKPTLEVAEAVPRDPATAHDGDELLALPASPLRQASAPQAEVIEAAPVRAAGAEPAAGERAANGPGSRELSVLDALAHRPAPEPAPEPEAGELLPSLDDLDDLPAEPPAQASATPNRVRTEVLPSATGSHRRAEPELPAAGFWLRLEAALVDGAAIGVVALVISLIAGGPTEPGGRSLAMAAFFALSFLVPVFGWSLWGTTPGKRLFGLYVRETQGGSQLGIGAGKAILRYLGYFASTIALGIGFLMIAFNQGKRGLHDVIAGTYVGRRS